MKKSRIGATALEVTEIQLRRSIARRSIPRLYHARRRRRRCEAAWDAGLRYFDTAPFYGFGLSERRFGDFLRDKPRNSYVLSTKVGRLLRPVPEDQVPDTRLCRAAAVRAGLRLLL